MCLQSMYNGETGSETGGRKTNGGGDKMMKLIVVVYSCKNA